MYGGKGSFPFEQNTLSHAQFGIYVFQWIQGLGRGRKRGGCIQCYACLLGAVACVHSEAHTRDIIRRDDDPLRQPLCTEKEGNNEQRFSLCPKWAWIKSVSRKGSMITVLHSGSMW